MWEKLAKTFVSALMAAAMKMISEERLTAMMQDYVQQWAEKHLTADEINGEIKDLGKLLKDKWNL